MNTRETCRKGGRVSDPKPTTPDWLREAAKAAQVVTMGDGHTSIVVRSDDEVAQAVWEALLNEGKVREKGTYAYTWERSLVVPLLGATRTKDTT